MFANRLWFSATDVPCNLGNEDAQVHNEAAVQVFSQSGYVCGSRRVERPHLKAHDLGQAFRCHSGMSAALFAEAELAQQRVQALLQFVH